MAESLIQEYVPQTPAKASVSETSAVNATLCDGEAFPLNVTERAVSMVQAALKETGGEEGEVLRVGVKGGGCSGLSYSLNFVDEISADDYLVRFEDVKVIVDGFSATFLDGTVLDYVETLQGAGFKFENPQAKRTCGCGSSFAT
jgi:iron-sulfur cluster assembly accessory protein